MELVIGYTIDLLWKESTLTIFSAVLLFYLAHAAKIISSAKKLVKNVVSSIFMIIVVASVGLLTATRSLRYGGYQSILEFNEVRFCPLIEYICMELAEFAVIIMAFICNEGAYFRRADSVDVEYEMLTTDCYEFVYKQPNLVSLQ